MLRLSYRTQRKDPEDVFRNLEKQLTDYLVADQARFYRLAYSYLKDREEALDAVQTRIRRGSTGWPTAI